MSDERLRKAEKDYSTEVDEQLARTEQLARGGGVDAALEPLLGFEKKTRQANDIPSLKRVLVAIGQLLTDPTLPNWDRLDSEVPGLAKKHGQSREAITALVQEVINRLDLAPGLDAKLATIDMLRTLTEGRIYLELERARVTQILAKIEVEQNQNYVRAADLMGELQVETFGSMDMSEKTDFILEQVELYTKKGDFQQAAIVSRKILPRYFKDADKDKRVEEQKIRFYELKVKIALHEQAYLEVCTNMRHIFDTPAMQANEERKLEILGNMVLFAVLAPHDNLQSDILQHLAREPDLAALSLSHQLVTMFTTWELIRWPKVVEVYGRELRSSWVLAEGGDKSDGEKRWEDLHQRIVEHNIRVVAKFYTRISIPGLTELLDLTQTETEDVLAKLVVNGTVWARIDRPKRIINFAKPQDVNDVLNEWSNNTSRLLEHVETIGHLISKEEMMHGIRSAKA